MAQGKLHIGTSGWHYDHWQGPFYPDDLTTDRRLAFYGNRFDCAEINNSFNQLPSELTLKSWRKQVPQSFIFTAKMSRYLTHMKKLKDPAEPIERFDRAMAPLGRQLAVTLLQLPPNWRANPERLDQVLARLGRRRRVAVECRDPDWWSDEIAAVLSRHGAAFCLFDIAGKGPLECVTADFVYCRLHGPRPDYAGRYDGRTLHGWSRRIARWRDRGLDVFVFFDNDQGGAAALDAQRLMEQCGASSA